MASIRPSKFRVNDRLEGPCPHEACLAAALRRVVGWVRIEETRRERVWLYLASALTDDVGRVPVAQAQMAQAQWQLASASKDVLR
jgi:hypothetical protein